MDTTAYIALSRQTALRRDMSIMAGNIANAQTTGYKSESTLFRSVIERAGEPGEVAFVQDEALVRDLGEGPLIETGNPLDLAIAGDGYFSVQTDAGVRYTRAGHFELDAAGQVVTAAGDRLLDDAGAPLVLPPDLAAVAVADNGTISVGGEPLARLELVSFENQQALEREGASLLRSDAPPVPVEGSRILQRKLEGSNVRSVMEMTAMMETLRAFQGTQKLIEAHHELERRTIEQMGGAGS